MEKAGWEGGRERKSVCVLVFKGDSGGVCSGDGMRKFCHML